MDFQLSPRQRDLIDAARGIARGKLLPLTADHSVAGVRRLRAAMAEHGLLGLDIGEAYGGVGLPLLDALLVIQTLQEEAPELGALAHRSSTGAIGAIRHHGTEAQKRRFLTGVAKGELGVAIGITEPDAGSAATAMTTRAEIDGDHVVLNGRKQFVSFVQHTEFTVVYCRFGRSGKARDIGAVIVPHDSPGFSHSPGALNMADESQFELYFDDCRVPRDLVLLDGEAFGKLISVYNAERLGSIARMLGNAAFSYRFALDYAQQRRQFNRTISDFQGIQWMLADMRVRLDAATLLVWRAAANADADGGTGLPARDETSIAKLFVAEAAKRICDDAIQIAGANGYMKDYPLARRYAETRGGSIYGGTLQIHRNMLASEILGREISQWRRADAPAS